MKSSINIKLYITTFLFAASFTNIAQAQNNAGFLYPTTKDTTEGKAFKPHGELWGQVFVDYYYKAHGDTVNGGRGGTNQYTGVPANRNGFQFRRVYLGYNYDISKTFSAELLISAEDDFSSGDLLQDNKFSPYIKWANVRWKNIYPGADLVVGQAPTPAFALLTDKVWGYRSVERTVADLRRTPSYDLGAMIQGRFIPSNENFGYDLMVGNGTTSKPESDQFKWFYGDVYAKLFNSHLTLDLYADYERLNWTPAWKHDRNMIKAFAAYTTQNLTVGVEAFVNTIHKDDIATHIGDGKSDTITNKASAISVYVRGSITRQLGYFARFDAYNPTNGDKNAKYSKYTALTTNYDPNTGEQFISAGLDWSPIKSIHIMPNVWYDAYANKGPKNYGVANNSYDLTYRLTLSYSFGAYPQAYNPRQ